MRKILLNNKVFDIDISDGEGNMKFIMDGAGRQKIYLNNKFIGEGYVEYRDCLDGTVSYIQDIETKNFSMTKIFKINDKRYERLKNLSNSSIKEINKVPEANRVLAMKFALKYLPIEHIKEGYLFGKEIVLDYISFAFNKDNIVFFTSNHNGYLAPDILAIDKTHDKFDYFMKLISDKLHKYFDFQ